MGQLLELLMNLLVFLTFLFANSNLLKFIIREYHESVFILDGAVFGNFVKKVTALQKSGGKTSVGSGKVDIDPFKSTGVFGITESHRFTFASTVEWSFF